MKKFIDRVKSQLIITHNLKTEHMPLPQTPRDYRYPSPGSGPRASLQWTSAERAYDTTYFARKAIKATPISPGSARDVEAYPRGRVPHPRGSYSRPVWVKKETLREMIAKGRERGFVPAGKFWDYRTIGFVPIEIEYAPEIALDRKDTMAPVTAYHARQRQKASVSGAVAKQYADWERRFNSPDGAESASASSAPSPSSSSSPSSSPPA